MNVATPSMNSRLPDALALIVVICMCMAGFVPSKLAAGEAALWQAVRSSGTVVLLRHAIAPGTGDPDTFTLGDCSTQRNLSEEGRAQAVRIGARFQANVAGGAQVYSSQWCRCLETARLLGLGPVKELPALNSFFGRYGQRDEQIRAMREWIARATLDKPVVFVTHQVNITGLTGVYPGSGEMVIVRRSGNGALTTLGTIATD